MKFFLYLLTPPFFLAALALAVVGSLVFVIMPDTTLQSRLMLVAIDRTTHAITTQMVWLAKAIIGSVGVICLASMALILIKFTQAQALLLSLRRDAQSFGQQVRRDTGKFDISRYRTEAVGLGCLIVAGFAIRLTFVLDPISYDESHTYVFFASRTFLDVISDYTMPNNHFFHTVLAHLSLKTLGSSLLALRLPAFIAGLLVIPMSYWLMHRLFDGRTALLSAGLTAVGPAMVEYSGQARGYTLMALFFLLGFTVGSYLRERSSVTGWGVFIITFTLGIYTVPILIIGLAIVATWMLVTATKGQLKRMLMHLAKACAAIGAGVLALYFLPLVRTGLPDSISQAFLWWDGLASRVFIQLSKLSPCWTGYTPDWLKGVLALGIVCSALPYRKATGINRMGSMPIIFSVVAGSLVVLIIFGGTVPPARSLNFLFPLAAGLSAYGLSRLFSMILPSRIGMSRLAWFGVVILICGTWWLTRMNTVRNDARLPGVESINCCAEGYFSDAEDIVERFVQRPGSVDVLVAHGQSGVIGTTRFYMMMAGLSPTIVHPYDSWRPLRQLSPYREVYFVVKRSELRDKTTIRNVLGITQNQLDRDFFAPVLIERYLVSDLYQLRWRNPPAEAPTAEVLRSNIRYLW